MINLTDLGLLLFRVSISLFMMFGHGWGKLNRLLSGGEIKFFDPFGLGSTISMGLAVFAEFFVALLVALGLFTRFGSLALIITMFIAGVIYHFEDPFGMKEKALMYLAGYLLLFLTGPGKYSLQALVKNRFTNKSGFIRFITG